MSIPAPLINGVFHDFSSIRANIKGIPFFGITAIDYTASKPVGDIYGTSSYRLGRTRGQLKFTGSLSIMQTEWAALAASLAVAKVALMETTFPIMVQYSDFGLPTLNDTLSGCLITNISNSHSAGNSPLVVKLDLDIVSIRYNGVSMLSVEDLPGAINAVF